MIFQTIVTVDHLLVNLLNLFVLTYKKIFTLSNLKHN